MQPSTAPIAYADMTAGAMTDSVTTDDAPDVNPARDDDAPGWFGKLATLGDFAQRRLPAAWVQACDAWLSQGLATSRARLGDAWLATYLTSPPQRFAWAPGVIDDQWWFGLFMPSCDSAGRYFPLLIARSRDDMPVDSATLESLDRWYRHLVDAAMRTLDERGAPVEALEAALQRTPAWHSPAAAGRAATDCVALAGCLRVSGAAPLPQWLSTLAAATLREALDGCSLWWPVGAEGEAASVRIVRGLPWDEDFVALLSNH